MVASQSFGFLDYSEIDGLLRKMMTLHFAQNDDASVIPMRHDAEQYGNKNDREPLTGVLERTYSIDVGCFHYRWWPVSHLFS